MCGPVRTGMQSLVRPAAAGGEQEKSRRHHCLRDFLFLDLSLSSLKKDLYRHLYRVKLVQKLVHEFGTCWSQSNKPMAKIKVVLDQRRPNSSGLYPLKFRVTHQSKSAEICTGFKASPLEFDDRRECLIRKINCRASNE